MVQHDTTNQMFRIAEDMVCNSNENIFLTGKAGTGKTTFLRHIKNTGMKNLAIVAPTGVAAINAGGSTIHSFFQLPFGPFNYNETKLFFSRLKINNERRQVFRQLELLIIDEISMVRADLLDAIDVTLRHFRFRPLEPFGGVQVLMIGDMYQLSPVARREEWELIAGNYLGHYFFDSRVMQQYPPVQIAFDKIYRQQDQKFVDLLNQVRNNNLDEYGLDILQSLYRPSFKPSDKDDHIILTTHNQTADKINYERLANLSSPQLTFKATIEGDFGEKNYPVEKDLLLKAGARVMFIKNDVEKDKRYFNGKIGTIVKLSSNEIIVKCNNDDYEITVPRETWKNIRYTINKTSQQLEEDVLGTFSQYPLRLAWAVTIHKSQGLTFDRVVIDAGAAFAPGQVYVALSRCTNLEGVVLLSQIPKNRLANDYRVVQFSANQLAHDRLEELLQTARRNYQQKILLELFDFSVLHKEAKDFIGLVKSHEKDFNESLLGQLDVLKDSMSSLEQVGINFARYMNQKFQEDLPLDQNVELQDKIRAAVLHFKSGLINLRDHMNSLKPVTDSKTVAREFNEAFKTLYINTALKYHMILSAANGFSIDAYAAAKKSFRSPSVTMNAYSAAASSVDPVSPHPDLYKQLKSLRDDICNKQNKPVYMVAGSRSLMELSTYLPQTKEQLQKISGFGKTNVEKYGDIFLDCINEYCAENDLTSSIEMKKPKRERKEKKDPSLKIPTHHITLDLYNQGLSLEDIAKQRGLALSTIQTHIAKSVSDGTLDPLLFTTKEKVDKILKLDQSDFEKGLTHILTTLGKGFSYFDIKLAMEYKRL